jgi:hypothetical protein
MTSTRDGGSSGSPSDNGPPEKSRRRRRAVREDADSPFGGPIEPANRSAVYAYRCAIVGLIPIVGMVLGPVALVWGWLAWRRGRTDPHFSALGPAYLAMFLGALLTLTQWAGAYLMYVGLREAGVL